MISWPWFLCWVARRPTSRPFSASGNDEQSPSFPTPSGESKSIRFRVLVPLSVAFCLLMGSFSATLYWDEQADLEDLLAEDNRSVQKHFEQEVKNQGATMSAALDAIRSDNRLAEAFRARARSALLERARTLFDRLREQNGITHFYFTAPDRVNILRVHQPDRFGDTIERVTTLRAEETNEIFAGLELGVLGTFTLRVVAPWKDEEGLVGYVELGKEIDGIFHEVGKAAGADLCVFVRKEYLTRDGYEEGARMLGRTPQWDRFPKAVLVHQTRDTMPQQIFSLLTAAPACVTEAAGEDAYGAETLEDGRVYAWRFFCLEDAAGREVGDVAILRDVTADVTGFYKSVVLGVAVCILVGGLLFGFFYAFLGRVQDRLHGAQRRVVEQALAQERTQRRHAEEMEEANRRLEELATTDELTALANRRRFLEAVGLEAERARRYGSDFALAMVDVDDFKAINDVYGHVFGDRVLVEVAKALKDGARTTDLVARYGGDEFMVLMPNADMEAATIAVERLRSRVAEHPASDGKRSLGVTVSAGISALDSKDRTAEPDLLIRRADEALYAAKRGGRNITKTWNEIAPDWTEGGADEAARVSDLRREVVGLSLQAKEMVVQSLWGLVHALEARDACTKGHSENVTRYAVAIAETLGLSPEERGVIRRAAMVHDIGKIGVPDSILQKRGSLTPHERHIMQRHVLMGVEILDQMHFLERKIPLVRHHHERWDGAGYPDGIAGEAIPLGARILAVADAFDAITSDRVYRKARSVSQALQILVEESGRQFAPGVVDAMVKWVSKIGRELGKDSGLTVADLLETTAVPVPV